jgi:hypothetical protein
VLTSAPSNDLSATGGFRGLPWCAVFRNLADGTRDQAGEHRGRSYERSACQHIGTLRSPQEISRLGQKLVSKPSASGPRNTGASPTQGRRAVYSNLLKTGKFACDKALKSARSIAAVSS